MAPAEHKPEPESIIARLLVLAPVTLPLIVGWAIFYSIESEIDANLKKQGRVAFVLGQTRLFLLLPLTAILSVVVWQDFVEYFVFSNKFSGTAWINLIRIAPLALIALAFPAFLRIAWKTEPLPAGPLKQSLEHRCKELKFVKRDILLWENRQSAAKCCDQRNDSELAIRVVV